MNKKVSYVCHFHRFFTYLFHIHDHFKSQVLAHRQYNRYHAFSFKIRRVKLSSKFKTIFGYLGMSALPFSPKQVKWPRLLYIIHQFQGQEVLMGYMTTFYPGQGCLPYLCSTNLFFCIKVANNCITQDIKVSSILIIHHFFLQLRFKKYKLIKSFLFCLYYEELETKTTLGPLITYHLSLF